MTPPAISAASVPTAPSRAATISGRVLTGLAVAFLLFNAIFKLTQAGAVAESENGLGFTAADILVLGFMEVALLVVYLVPRTALLGAVLWTGYLGGAVAIHFRLHNPLLSHTLFPTYVGAMLWGGLWLRDLRVRQLFPFPR